jgi:hypothetical protein
MTTNEILAKLETRDANQGTESLGTIKQLFADHEMFVVRKSKNNAKRAAVLLKKDGKVHTVVCSEEMTPLVRSGQITKENLAGFPVIYNEERNALFVGLPAEGWVSVKTITVRDFVPSVVSPENLL